MKGMEKMITDISKGFVTERKADPLLASASMKQVLEADDLIAIKKLKA